MARAWPFENKPAGGKAPDRFRTPQEFAAAKGEGADAVVIRIGGHDSMLVLVDAEGAWDRWVYHSKEEALSVAAELGFEPHVDEYPEELRVRINSRQRPAESFAAGAYPEQGGVGPLIPYPENRPRREDDSTPEGAVAEATE